MAKGRNTTPYYWNSDFFGLPGSARWAADDYRVGLLQAPMITMLGAAYATAERSKQADAMFLAMACRSCAAIRDLNSLDLL